MHKLLLLLFLLLGIDTLTSAQIIIRPPVKYLPPTPAPGSYRFRLDSLLTALDKNQIPTGILYDRVFPLARLDQFGQTTTDTTRFEHFVQAHQELWYASYRAVPLGSTTTLRARAAQHRQAGMVPIGVLHYRFNLLDTLAVQRNLSSQPGGEGGALFDVAGRAQSPYLARETVVAAALATSVPAGTVQFGLPTNLLLDNTGNPLQSLTLDFNDGTPSATLTPGSAGVYKFYEMAGEYFIRLTAHFTNGSSKVVFTSIKVKGAAVAYRGSNPDFPIINPCNPSLDIININASISFNDYEGRNEVGSGETTTYYANCNNRQLTKPVIAVSQTMYPYLRAVWV